VKDFPYAATTANTRFGSPEQLAAFFDLGA
jgi:hypothetical protein